MEEDVLQAVYSHGYKKWNCRRGQLVEDLLCNGEPLRLIQQALGETDELFLERG